MSHAEGHRSHEEGAAEPFAGSPPVPDGCRINGNPRVWRVCSPESPSSDEQAKTEVGVMATYVLLVKLTDKGAADIENVPQRIDQSIKAWKEVGGKDLTVHLTMGEYDYCCIGEAPDDETVAKFLFKLAKRGNVRTSTMKAFSKEQVAQLLAGADRKGLVTD
jgi:uncharacterized protein with GYD domain